MEAYQFEYILIFLVNMPHTWEQALRSYRYPVTLADFQDAHLFPGWFSFDLHNGDRTYTVEFESHFRKHAQESLAPWLEVIFWKLYSQLSRRDRTTRQVASHFQDKEILAMDLWRPCMAYIKTPTRQTFNSFRGAFGFQSEAIAVAATFPAFIDPAYYPMVDTRIAKWVGICKTAHNDADSTGPQLISPPFLDSNRTVLTMADYEFMRRWIQWCVHTATKLTKFTPLNWRARDVEMAVFYAWGGKGDSHPMHHLNPLLRS